MSRHTDVLGLAMGDKTHISWTADEDGRRGATWNFVHGCERVSPGCTFCYIELQPPLRMTGMRFNGHQVGATTGVRLRPEVLTKPMHWRRPRKIFTNRLSDTFHDAIPSEVLAKAWAVMACCPDHTFQILTKRHGRMRSVLSRPDFRDEVDEEITQLMRAAKPPGRCWPVTLDRTTDDGWNIWGPAQWTLPWAWIGVTAEDQDWLERRWSALRATPAALRWLSCEPLLGPIRLCRCDGAAFETKRHPFLVHPECPLHGDVRVNWVVVGGESGPIDEIRPMDPEWARSLQRECEAAGVAFHFKQLGTLLAREGCTGKGTDPAEWPEPFPRQYPGAPADRQQLV